MQELKQKTMKMKMKTEPNKLEWVGDKIKEDDRWPNQTRDGTFRIFSQNINGTPTKNKYIDWEMLLDNINTLQADVICLSELNLDVNKAEVAHTLLEKAKNMDRHLKMKLVVSNTTVNGSVSKRGGTAIMT